MPKKNKTKTDFLNNLGMNNEIINQAAEVISFNYRYFQYGEKGGQSFEEWEKEKYLSDLNNKLKNFSAKKKQELIQEGTLELYTSYPQDSLFEIPRALVGRDLSWARFRITGARRLIGFFLKKPREDSLVDLGHNWRDIFFVVFLDKDHEFAPYSKS